MKTISYLDVANVTISQICELGSRNATGNVESLGHANGQPLVEILAGKAFTSRYYVNFLSIISAVFVIILALLYGFRFVSSDCGIFSVTFQSCVQDCLDTTYVTKLSLDKSWVCFGIKFIVTVRVLLKTTLWLELCPALLEVGKNDPHECSRLLKEIQPFP